MRRRNITGRNGADAKRLFSAQFKKGDKTIPNYLANFIRDERNEAVRQRVYATGCAGQDVTLLPKLLDRLDAVLIDIRFAPWSRQLEWRKDYLQLLLKKRYLHVSHLGNRAHREEGKIVIQNLSLGIKVITELRVNLLLMCSCEKPELCHRTAITRALIEKGIEPVEIADWKTFINQEE